VDSQEEKDVEMEFQDAKRAPKAIYGHSDSDSSDNKRRKMLHVMFEGSWAITSRRVVKTLRREVMVAAPHRKWVETRLGLTPPTAPRAWMVLVSSHCWSPRPSPTSGCTMS
jgi:hypothetical protein